MRVLQHPHTHVSVAAREREITSPHSVVDHLLPPSTTKQQQQPLPSLLVVAVDSRATYTVEMTRGFDLVTQCFEVFSAVL
jgi:hypothetical protein